MPKRDIVFAIEDIQTGNFKSKRTGNPFYTSYYQAKQKLDYLEWYNKGKPQYRIAKFRLERVEK